MADSIHLDHLALASRRAWDNLVRYVRDLGGTWIGGTDDYAEREDLDFYFAQVEFDGGTKLELLEPLPGVPGSDFLDRFIHRNGPGPHHFTFKVPDLDDAMAAVSAEGYELVSVSRENENWQEAFLHPKQSHGIVIQLACQGPDGDGWVTPPSLPPSPQAGSRIDKVVHLVADLDAAVALFGGPLGMDVGDEIEHTYWKGRVLTDGPWTLELVQPEPSAPAAHWMGTRAGRLLQVCMEVPSPGSVPDVDILAGDVFQLHPEVNLGTRVLLRPLGSAG